LERIEESEMSRDERINWRASSLLVILLVAALSSGQTDEPFVQADVYDALYEAHVQCEEDLDQSRSEFITDMFERNRDNRVSMELLTKLLTHNINVAKQSVAEKERERELYVAKVLQAPAGPDPIDSPDASKERHKKIKQIDDFLKKERQYVEVNECVLAILQQAPES
jgi:hypothetical protein